VNVEVEAGAQRMVGMLKGRLVGVEAGLGARAPATPTEKLRAKVEIPALRVALCPGSRSRDRPRLSGRKTRWRPTRTPGSPSVLKNFFGEKVSSKRRPYATRSFAHGRERQVMPSPLARGARLETSHLTRTLSANSYIFPRCFALLSIPFFL